MSSQTDNAEKLLELLTDPSFGEVVSAPGFSATGLTGATAGGRYVGATASGAPTTGTFATGDWCTDQTGKRWTCTADGSPGTWTQEPGTGGGSSLGTSIAMSIALG